MRALCGAGFADQCCKYGHQIAQIGFPERFLTVPDRAFGRRDSHFGPPGYDPRGPARKIKKTSPAAAPATHSQTVDSNHVTPTSPAVHIGDHIPRITARPAESNEPARSPTNHPATPRIKQATTNPTATRLKI